MKKFFLAAILALGMAMAAGPASVLSEATKGAIYNLWVSTGNRIAAICTGTVVATSDGPRFLSAGHCVADFPRTARYYISREADPDYLVRVRLKWWEFQGIERWKEGDFSVFELPQSFKSPALPLCASNPAVGEDVWSWTGPLGMLPIFRSGIYSGELHFPDDQESEDAIGGMGFVDIEGAPGSSGSGMLRLEKNAPCVWGIWVGGYRERPSGAIIAPIPQVLR